MTRPLKLYLPLKNFETLYAAADGRGKSVSVNKMDLLALLTDHSRALARLADLQVATEEDYTNNKAVRQARKG